MLNNLKATFKNGGISVTNQHGEIVTYVMLQNVYVSPTATPDEAYQAGAVANQAIDVVARNAGCTSVVLVLSPEHPHFPEERWVRIVERPIVTMPEVGCNTSAQTHFIN
jgi:hypothetical protein